MRDKGWNKVNVAACLEEETDGRARASENGRERERESEGE